MKDYLLELKELILSDISHEELINKLDNYHDSDIADVLESLSEEERLKAYEKIGTDRLASIFTYFENVEDYIEEVSPEIAADIIEEMDSNDAADVLNELDESDKSQILHLMDTDAQVEVLKVDSYDENEIGSYMSDNFIVVKNTNTIPEATKLMISEAGDHDNIFTIYVVDDNNEYCGAIDFKSLITARKKDDLDVLIHKSYPFFHDTDIMSECIEKLKDYAEDSIPVLNSKNEIIGVITSDIVIDATEEELGEDYAKLAGLTDEEDIDDSIFASVKKRIPWLIILLFLGLIESTVTSSFEGVIAALPVVFFFQSMILDMSGNVGTQSLAVTIRNLSSEDGRSKVKKGIWKEFRVGITNGLIIALIALVFVFAYLSIRQMEIAEGAGYQVLEALKVSAIIGASMFFAMSVSNLIGTLFPIVLDKIHIDPAVASGPFITTINDMVAIALYYGLVWLLFLVI